MRQSSSGHRPRRHRACGAGSHTSEPADERSASPGKSLHHPQCQDEGGLASGSREGVYGREGGEREGGRKGEEGEEKWRKGERGKGEGKIEGGV